MTFDLLVVSLLATLAYGYLQDSWNVRSEHMPAELSGLPLRALWFGALGGVTYSLKGVFEHRLDWEDSWGPWHVCRPLTGAVAGGMTYVALLMASDEAPRGAAVYVVAFAFGFEERRFFSFLAQVARLVVQTVDEKSLTAVSVTAVNPPRIVNGGEITIHGANLKDVSVSLGSLLLSAGTVSQDGKQLKVQIPDGAPLGSQDLRVVGSEGAGTAQVDVVSPVLPTP